MGQNTRRRGSMVEYGRRRFCERRSRDGGDREASVVLEIRPSGPQLSWRQSKGDRRKKILARSSYDRADSAGADVRHTVATTASYCVDDCERCASEQLPRPYFWSITLSAR